MNQVDQLHRFIFEDTDIRGVLVNLHGSYTQVLSQHDYPPALGMRLGEMMAAVCLLSSTLKFEGRLSLMARGDGPVRLLQAECNNHNDIRALARWDGELEDDLPWLDMLGKGHLVITIEPEQGQRYQGVVPLEQPQLAGCLEDYFRQSEQLNTQILLAADLNAASGMMLQALPTQNAQKAELDWEHLSHLGSTLSCQELLELDDETILHRLYHQEQVRLYEPKSVQFGCDCSRERSLDAVRSLGQQEIDEILAEQGAVKMNCQFCNQAYEFGAECFVDPDDDGTAVRH